MAEHATLLQLMQVVDTVNDGRLDGARNPLHRTRIDIRDQR
eukprot:CAMPEP_0202724642 /NCGR_PEP_ID=MMETSP1385-20130828/175314_1 /ASSEMBLY_ACC=CAM_ASM_000861 /TAXON_ID=933848 /ORGANISM="Elphidium margaritaceum" /LENGTH=40 /DNA_ID= /DNA_START= /DNA_END= /DNA_ORIENTATION=